MARAIDAATLLIQLAAGAEDPDSLTHLRLQKLVYYTQAWSLVLRGLPLFPERIEAWAHGPVVKELYPVFAKYGNKPIPAEEWKEPVEMGEDEASLVDAVWDMLKGYSGSGLRELTHNEDPWKDARKNLDPSERCDTEITQTAIRNYFAQFVKN